MGFKVVEVLEPLGFHANTIRKIYNKIMMERVEKGEAEKLANGLYWIKKNKYCLN